MDFGLLEAFLSLLVVVVAAIGDFFMEGELINEPNIPEKPSSHLETNCDTNTTKQLVHSDSVITITEDGTLVKFN